ncbi:D-lactate dehydrogenase [Enterococcus sp. PF1-24]|uniref:D-2-hydroxyacid dehydrogenase n=1 Tax=unclassified Enterococcus TaxID=2608891 RepID=UPI002472F263|nr:MULTISPECIES: D-2-hydroxyacid dehydrogenase [unclassified Enterococcus]MDH6363499.1 D-lactate dehydrogenase [Enterococcus sp. PFB1-1]MDH6400593.1 D-lactate dehydrogenase [Enterococcus sp. PF1-24]
MKRILCFEVNEERLKFVSKWSEENGVQVDSVPYKLTLETVNEVEGYDGISVSEAGIFDSRIFSKLKSYGIKQVAQRTVGYEGFDIEAATQNGIIITNVSNYSPESIAEFTIMLALQLIRNSKQIEKNVKNLDFRWAPNIRGRLIRDMNVAVIGVGHIGEEVAKLFKALGATVFAYATHKKSYMESFLEYKESIEDAIKDADIVTLHIPGKKSNYHLFNEKFLKRMKEGSYLINTARGSLINTIDLLNALNQGHIAGAALDVYEYEEVYISRSYQGKKIEDNVFKQMLDHPAILFCPHCAYYTDVSMKNMVYHALDSVMEVVCTGDSPMRVN